MTLKLEGDLDILKMHLHAINEVARLRHLKVFKTPNGQCNAYIKFKKKYKNSSQRQRSRSNVTHFQLLAFTVGHIPAKLHQFLISSFRDFVWTDTQMPPKTIPAHSIAGVQVINPLNNTFLRHSISVFSDLILMSVFVWVD